MDIVVLVKQVPDGLLTGADSASMHLLAVLYTEFLESDGQYPTSRINALRGLMADFGLSPGARARLAVPEPKSSTDDF